MKIYDEEETVISRRASVVAEADEPTVAEDATVAAGVAAPGVAPEVSLFLPVKDEADNLRPLHAKIDEALAALGRTAEVIYVDDGSSDGSLDALRGLAARDPRVRVIALRRNYGQTAAMAAGIDAARGRILIPMDADLQNDPADIVRLLDKLDEGFDVVSGWRKERQDKMVTRKIPSAIANWLISVIGGVKLHDYGCSLKAYRREFLKEVKLYGEMHRFIPIYASWVGARVTEIPVRHHKRRMGRSKYGLSRTFKVMLDLLTIKFMASYHTKPIYVFGFCGFGAFTLSLVAGVWALARKIEGESFIRNPLLGIAVVMFAVGLQFILMGLLAEMLVRTYHESQAKPTYTVRERIGFEDES
jgi:glycosyltransferase involved in cell wall biosynthesis